MLNGKKIIVVLPAYNAGLTLEKTYSEIPFDMVDDVILVDDASRDNTYDVALKLGIRHVFRHEKNKGYGGNQKTCFNNALSLQADIVVILHPDYQYTPSLIPAMCSLISRGVYPVVFGSRILGKGAIKGGMPLYKYIFNRLLTFIQNVLMSQKLSEYHTGFRAYDASVLRAIKYDVCSDDFVFDNEIIAQIFYAGFQVAEVTCPTRYFKEASSINFFRSVIYGLGVIRTSMKYALSKGGIIKFELFK